MFETKMYLNSRYIEFHMKNDYRGQLVKYLGMEFAQLFRLPFVVALSLL